MVEIIDEEFTLIDSKVSFLDGKMVYCIVWGSANVLFNVLEFSFDFSSFFVVAFFFTLSL